MPRHVTRPMIGLGAALLVAVTAPLAPAGSYVLDTDLAPDSVAARADGSNVMLPGPGTLIAPPQPFVQYDMGYDLYHKEHPPNIGARPNPIFPPSAYTSGAVNGVLQMLGPLPLGSEDDFGAPLTAMLDTAPGISKFGTIQIVSPESADAPELFSIGPYDVLEHATPSLSRGTQTQRIDIDFGTIDVADTASSSQSVYNLGPPVLTADLDLDVRVP